MLSSFMSASVKNNQVFLKAFCKIYIFSAINVVRSFNFPSSLRHLKSFSILKSVQYEKRTKLLRFHIQKVEKIKEEIISINLFRLSQDILNPSCCQNARAYLFGSSYRCKRAHATKKETCQGYFWGTKSGYNLSHVSPVS